MRSFGFGSDRSVRTDRKSVIIRNPAAFAATEQVAAGTIDLRDHKSGCSVWLIVTDLGSVTSVDIAAYASDDGATVSPTTAKVKSDDAISAGVFVAAPYTMRLTTAGGTLVVGANGPFRIPQVAGTVRIGVTGNHASGSYSLRVQRYV